MRKFCIEMESGQYSEELKYCHQQVKNIEKWYCDCHKNFSTLLQSELSYEAMYKMFEDQKENPILDLESDYTFSFSAKLSLFCIADFLSKLILSCYCYGPSDIAGSKYGISFRYWDKNVDLKRCDLNGRRIRQAASWFDYKANVMIFTEVLAQILKIEQEGENLALGVLLEDRSSRSNLTHGGRISVCMSALRCYNVLRDMILFLDPESESMLPRFR